MASIKTSQPLFIRDEFSIDDEGNLNFSFERDVNGIGLNNGESIAEASKNQALDSSGNLKDGYLEEELQFNVTLTGDNKDITTDTQTYKFYYKIERQTTSNGFYSTPVYLYITDDPCNEKSPIRINLKWKSDSESPVGQYLFTMSNTLWDNEVDRSRVRFRTRAFGTRQNVPKNYTHIKFSEFGNDIYPIKLEVKDGRVNHYYADNNDIKICDLNKPLRYGDVNRDGVIDQKDVDVILQYVGGFLDLDSQQLLLADVSGNGSVSAIDASFIRRYISGLNNFGRTNELFNPLRPDDNPDDDDDKPEGPDGPTSPTENLE